MKFNGANIILQALEYQGIKVISGIPGGANLPIYHELSKSSIRHILARHEQGAGFIAQGMARSTGRPAVCLVTSGPGVTNLLTAIADAYMDSVPLIAICGQVPSSLIGTNAFQEVNTSALVAPITKGNFCVSKIEDLPHILMQAFDIAQSGRQGPVVIDIPKDIQMAEMEFPGFAEISSKYQAPQFKPHRLSEAARLINSSGKPVLYIGGGIIYGNAAEPLRELAEKGAIPVASTLMGLGAFSPANHLYLGMLGMHGQAFVNHVLDEADLLIALGVRFDDRATGKITEFCRHAKIIHVDIDQREIGKIKKVDCDIHGDISSVLNGLLPLIQKKQRNLWLARIESIRNSSDSISINNLNESGSLPERIIHKIRSLASAEAIITTDVGQHQMWVAQYFPFYQPRKFLTSGGLGTMGFGLPAAIGAALANPVTEVICFSGDGSIMMNIQELATLHDLNLNLKIIIFNNGHLGLVRQQQDFFYEKNYFASQFQFRLDFAEIARNFGIRAMSLKAEEDFEHHTEEFLRFKGPALLDISIAGEHWVLPMVPPGKANREMILAQ
jgi:acetolactate synthase-1/2/3 large subunit